MSEIEFQPTIVYKDVGPHLRPGGTFDYAPARTLEEFNNRLEHGWFRTLSEAIEGKVRGDEGKITQGDRLAKANKKAAG